MTLLASLLLALFLPQVPSDVAYRLKDAGFPQGGLHDRYYNGTFYVPAGSRLAVRDYYGTTPKPEWAYVPTADELAAAMTGTMILMRDGEEWVALGESATGSLLEGTGSTLAESLANLFLAR